MNEDGLPECWCVNAAMRVTECPRHYPVMTDEQRARIKARVMARIKAAKATEGGREMPRTVNPWDWTNATKAQALATLQAFLGLLLVFGLDITPEQIGAIMTFAGLAAALFVQLTYRNSPSHIDRAYEAIDHIAERAQDGSRVPDGFRDYPRAEFEDYVRRARDVR